MTKIVAVHAESATPKALQTLQFALVQPSIDYFIFFGDGIPLLLQVLLPHVLPRRLARSVWITTEEKKELSKSAPLRVDNIDVFILGTHLMMATQNAGLLQEDDGQNAWLWLVPGVVQEIKARDHGMILTAGDSAIDAPALQTDCDDERYSVSALAEGLPAEILFQGAVPTLHKMQVLA